MKKAIIVFTGFIALLIVGILVLTLVPAGSSSKSGSLADGMKASAANVAIDASGIKGRVAQTLEENIETISRYTGMTEAEVDVAIADLDIDSWTATVLPSDVQVTGTVSGDAAGVDGSLTLYDDPDYVTVNAYGQEITMLVPESAQQYLPYLTLL